MRNLILIFIFIFSYSCNANEFDAAFGYCKIVMPGAVTDPEAAYYNLNPLAIVGIYAMDYNKNLDANKMGVDVANAKVTVMQHPSHGVLVGEGDLTDYHPNPEYDGNDTATFLVEVGGYKIKVVYYIYVGGVGNNELKYCPNNLRYQELPTTETTKPVSINVAPLENSALVQTKNHE